MKKEIKYGTINQLQKDLKEAEEDRRNYSNQLDAKTEEIAYLKEVIEDFEKQETVTLDSSNLMELQKAELLVKAQKKYSLQELEEMFGGNSFNL